MGLRPLSEELPIEFIVNDIGNAMLLHKGPLQHNYSWVQYDRSHTSLQFITENGDLQDLGMKIHKPFEAPLTKTRELIMIEVGDDNGCKDVVFVKCTQLVE